MASGDTGFEARGAAELRRQLDSKTDQVIELEGRNRELYAAAKMLERQRDEVQTKREEVEADLVEERRIHRQDVDELKASIDAERRRLIDERNLANSRADTAIAERDKRGDRMGELIDDRRDLLEALERIRDWLREAPGLDEIDRRILEHTNEAIAKAKVDDSIERGRHFLELYREQLDAGGSVIVSSIGPEEKAYYKGEPTEDGYRFTKVPGTEGAILDSFGGQKDLEKRLAAAKARAEGAEHRAEELQAWVDDLVLPSIDVLVEQLAGDEPAWWVTAADALGKLAEARGSILIHPPRQPRAEDLAESDGLGRR